MDAARAVTRRHRQTSAFRATGLRLWAHCGSSGRFEVSVCVGTDALVPVCAGDEEGRPVFTLGQKSSGDVPVLQYSTDSGIGRITRAVLGQRLALLETHVVVTAHLASVLRSMSIDGRGIAWLPLTLIEEDLASGRLVRASPDGSFDIPTEIRLYRSTVPAGKAGEAFWSAVLAHGSI
ncbi:LysR substrate-binding domain-containing protein [Variovorax arabinosiphilus]|uniref:LysR substrate-binding domain-containing protein n=1 Tax=Variovorax arabinosiphilus TaxID=3053498 RepID=UPI003365710D